MSNNDLKTELVYLLRNNNVLTKTQRSVTTQTDTATLVGATSHLINRTNVKNIRSVKVGLTTLSYGTDYTIDLDYDDSGTTKCKITFVTAQTGELEVSYDYGSDKIFGDYPRDDLKLDSYPRIAVDLISKSTDAFGIGGNTFISDTLVTIVVYSKSIDQIETFLSTIEGLLRTNAKSFYYAPFVKPIGRGPLIKPGDRNDIILHKNVDCMAMFSVESV